VIKVFLVEDELIVRESIKNNMKWDENGFEFCGEASDGELAFPKIQSLKPDIVITDIKMPFMNGLELSRLVKNEFEHIKIVVLSGYDEFEYAKEAINIGVTEYLVKPITSNELMKSLTAIGKTIRQEQAERVKLEIFKQGTLEKEFLDKKVLFNQLITATQPVSKLLEQILNYNVNTGYEATKNEDLNLKAIDVGKMDKKSIDTFLINGKEEEVASFIDAYFDSIGQTNIKSLIFRQYLTMDMYFSVVLFVKNLGYSSESINKTFKDACGINSIASSIPTTKIYFEKVFKQAINLRDLIATKKYNALIIKAKEYIECNYYKEELSLNLVAASVNISPSHFSMIFSQETGETFISYLTEVRMNKAKELLKCTDMKSSEIGYAVGYKDPHYFSYLFKKTQDCTTKQFKLGILGGLDEDSKK
jgi:two-component system response regulator YesN